MLYLAYQAHNDLIEPAKIDWPASRWRCSAPGVSRRNIPVVRNLSAAYELIARAGLTHARPEYGIPAVMVGNREVEVTEEAVLTLPFGTLLQVQEGHRHRAAARAGRGAAVGPLRDAAAQHRAHAACRTTTSTSPIGTTRATCRSKPVPSASTTTSTTSSSSWRSSGPARTSSPCASRASRRWPPSP